MDNQEIIERLNRLEKEVRAQKIDLNTSPETLDEVREILFENLTETLWNRVFYVASMTGPAVATTSASELFSGGTRESDTSAGKFLSPLRNSKFRCHFYYNGTDSLDSTGYIGSMGTSSLSTGITSINQSDMEYVALKVTNGVVTIVSKSILGTESKPTQFQIIDDTTYVLEIDFFPGERADLYLDKIYLGSLSTFLPGQKDFQTFFPLMVSMTRGGGTNRTVTIESWEFIQSRN